MSTIPSRGGRFAEGPARTAAEYTQSQSFDRTLCFHDIIASKAHARMLGRVGVVAPEEADAIIEGLDRVREEIASGRFVWRPELEDVHMNVEARLTELVGDAGRKLHTGRSRNDQVGLTFRLFVADRIAAWQGLALDLCETLMRQAESHRDTILPGCTHLQPAQPVALAHHLLAYAFMLRRDVDRLGDAARRTRVSPLGAAALGGTTYPLDPLQVAKDVGFDGICDNSMDAVSDRDFVLEACFCAATVMTHLSRLCEELVLWSNPAFGFVTVSDAFSTGSSIMPQKRNPDVAELMRGKTGRALGALTAMFTVMKGLPMTYNRDMQEDKEAFLDADRTVATSLGVMAGMMEGVVFHADRMAAACDAGYIDATELADHLVGKGMPFRQAHHATGALVALAESRGVPLKGLTPEELRSVAPCIEPGELAGVLDCATAVRRRETPGGTGPLSVARQLETLRTWVAETRRRLPKPIA
ncbi:MAG: argininosuccinate lyase [Desulfovibrio sp.]|jgi:argininosuccinate lyase|nr:argininosuccinate lyase [Desulfovibrio sp.]